MDPNPLPSPDGTIDPIEAAFAEADATIDRIQKLVSAAHKQAQSDADRLVADVHGLPTLVRAALRGADPKEVEADLGMIDVSRANRVTVRRVELGAAVRQLMQIRSSLHDARILARE